MTTEELKGIKRINNLFNHKMMKPLHDVYGVDWVKMGTDYKAQIHEGTFTLKMLRNEYDLNPNNLNLLLCDEGWRRELSVVRIHSDFTKYTLPETRKLSTFYSKVDFEDYRKKRAEFTLVLSIPMKYCSDFATYIQVENDKYSWFSLHNTLRDTSFLNAKFTNKNNRLYIDGKLVQKYFSNGEFENFADSIDKSGYSVVGKHIALSYKVDEIKQNKLKNCFNTRFNKDNAEIFSMLTNARVTLADRIKVCEDTESLYELSEKVREVYYIMTSYEKHIKNLADSNNDNTSNWHKYTSIGEVESQIGYLKERVNKVLSN